MAGEAVGCVSEVEVSGGDAAFTVGGECEGHFAPADVDVWMVIGFLGFQCHAGDKPHRLTEVGELVCATNPLSVAAPGRVGLDECIDFCI